MVATSDKHVYWLNTQSHAVALIKLNGQNAAFPSFSSDGTTMYFTPDKSGDWQIWSNNLQNKSTVQITPKGGYQGQINNTDDILYFTKYRQQGIWQLDLQTNKEKELVNNVSRSSNFKLCSDTIYYVLEAKSVDL